MKKSFFIAMTAGVAFTAALGFAHRPQTNTKLATSGAFRDGIYQAKVDSQSGRKASIRSGRWRSDADRALFLAGYHQQSDRSLAPANLPSGSEVKGFRDGVTDGAEARRSDQPFALRAAILRLAQVQSGDGHERDDRYVRAYANGYQYGYYSNHETLESALTGHTMNQF